MTLDEEQDARWRRTFGERIAGDMRAAAEAELKATTRRVVAVCAVCLAVVVWSLCNACTPTPAPAPDAALPRCSELACEDVLCNTAGVCQCRRPGLEPQECLR